MPSGPRGAVVRLRFALGFTLAFVALLVVHPATLAQEAPALAPGGTAWIANTGGDNVLLRDGASYAAAVLDAYPQSTPVTLAAGPLTADDGSLWYQVAVGDKSGFIDAGYLSPQWVPPADAAAAPAPPAEAPPAVPAESAPLPAPAPAPAPVAEPAAPAAPAPTYATTELNFRAGPGYDAPILTVLPAGAALAPTGEASNGFVGVAYQGQTGWVDAAYLGADPAAAAPPAPDPGGAPAAPSVDPAPPATSPLIVDPSAAPAGSAATATDVVNLRAGPSYEEPVLRVLPPGSPVVVTGEASGGFRPVWYNGTTGWIDGQYLADGGAAPASEGSLAAPQPAAFEGVRSGTATVAEAVNLRADPAITAPVVGSLPVGASFQPMGEPVGGFYPVEYNGASGWVSGAYLQFEDGGADPASPDLAFPEPADRPAMPGSAGLVWPVSGGTWYIMQGYNGTSHRNQSDLWQYGYSFDLARRDGDTAGALVYAPAAGTIRWFDPSSGGISIDIGNGHAVALYHITVDASLRVDQQLSQGQPIGVVSGPGGPGFAGSPHVQLTLWRTSDGGNWSRAAAPFVGPYAIAGQEFPDIGGSFQHQGYEFTP